jgi:hypothetical protein
MRAGTSSPDQYPQARTGIGPMPATFRSPFAAISENNSAFRISKISKANAFYADALK